MSLKKKSITSRLLPAHLVFLCLGSIFGLLFLLLTPPFQTPDEVNHFYKAYQISEGQFVSSKMDKRIGGYLPQDVAHVSESFFPMAGRMHEKTSSKLIFDRFEKSWKDPEFVDFANTAVYSPISYLPQSLGIFIANRFNAPPLFLMYIGRFCSLIFWITCVFFSIRMIPSFKWLITLLALLPMSLAVNTSLSADVMSNALAFLVIAHAITLAQSEKEWTRKQWVIALILGVLLASAKLVYVPIFLLYLLIPIRKFPSKRSFYFQLAVLAGVTLLTVAIWSKLMSGSHLTYAEYNAVYRDLSNLGSCADIHAQMVYISANWSFLIESLSNAFVIPFDMYARGYIGTFGWIDTYLPTWTIILSYMVVFFVAITDFSEKIVLKTKHRIVLLSSALLMFFLVVISQLLIWTCVGDAVVTNLQGRYFIPVFPLLFMALNVRWKRKIAWLPVLVAVFSVFSLVFSLSVVYKRYYEPSTFTDVSVKFTADDIAAKGGFSTKHSEVFSAAPGFESGLDNSSGSYRFKVSKDAPFGAAITVHGCQMGDWITVKADRFGGGGAVVVSSSDALLYRIEVGEKHNSDSAWVHLETSLLIPQPKFNGDMSVYLYLPEGDSSFFDNLEIIHRQFGR